LPNLRSATGLNFMGPLPPAVNSLSICCTAVWRMSGVPEYRPPADVNQAIDASYPSDIAKRARTLYQASGTDPLYGTPAEQWVEDYSFRCPSVAQLTWHAVAGNRSFEFQFDRLPPGFDKSRNAHHQEVQYVFGLGPGKFEAADYALSDAMQEYWTSFAKTGDPNGTGKLPNWPRFEPASKSFMEFTDAGPVVRKAFGQKTRRARCPRMNLTSNTGS
jgi:para-nitrobenzyl esterase